MLLGVSLLCVRANSPAATVHPGLAGMRSLSCGRSIYAGVVATLSWSAGGGTILMLRNFNKCKTIHTEQVSILSFSKAAVFYRIAIFPADQAKRAGFPHVEHGGCTTSSSDQVKIATLLFLTLFYTEHPAHSPLPNGNKLTTPEFVRQFYPAKWPGNQLCS